MRLLYVLLLLVVLLPVSSRAEEPPADFLGPQKAYLECLGRAAIAGAKSDKLLKALVESCRASRIDALAIQFVDELSLETARELAVEIAEVLDTRLVQGDPGFLDRIKRVGACMPKNNAPDCPRPDDRHPAKTSAP